MKDKKFLIGVAVGVGSLFLAGKLGVITITGSKVAPAWPYLSSRIGTMPSQWKFLDLPHLD